MDETEKPRDIAPLRQPMVTSLGIIMGFLLNFLASWATTDDAEPALVSTADYAVAITLLLAIAMMCVVLFRLLDISKPESTEHARYMVTFRLYMASIGIAFAGMGLSLFL